MKKTIKLLLIWAPVTILVFVILETASRVVIFSFPALGKKYVEYSPYKISTPDDIIPSSEKRTRIDNNYLQEYERVRLFLSDRKNKAQLIGDLEPNLDSIWALSIDHPYRVVSNQAGIRRKTNIDIPKPSNLFRIYCSGDSFTFGPYLSNNETWPNLLERILNYQNTNGEYEVLNAGIPGYKLRQEEELFVERGYISDPDLVILQALDNDVPNYGDNRFQRLSFPDDSVSDSLSYKLKLLIRKNAERFALIKLIVAAKLSMNGLYETQVEEYRIQREKGNRRQGTIITPQQKRASEVNDVWTNTTKKDRLEKYKRLNEKDFSKLVNFIRSKKIQLLVVLFPTEQLINSSIQGRNQVSEYYRELTASYNVDFVDLTPVFKSNEETKHLFLWPWNGHMSFKGNLTSAKALAPIVERYRR